ncbi:hypothetical protein K502DRAFT_104190 [Neoconidiobolus thromboides FSU 785]|nr:hypothetical protein K502DRAFT_104190 [Neoconidiobolus thromboides FSU 785]
MKKIAESYLKSNSTSDCIKCNQERITCKGCYSDSLCIISEKTCFECPKATCIQKSILENIPINKMSNTTIIIISLLVVSIISLILVILVMIRRKYFKESYINLKEKKHTNDDSFLRKLLNSNNENSFLNKLVNKNHKRDSSTFSMLNFAWDEGDELDQEISFEEMLKTDPKEVCKFEICKLEKAKLFEIR